MPDIQYTRVLRGIFSAIPSHNHAALKATGRAGRNLPAAVMTATLLVVLVTASLAFYFEFFVAFIMLLCWAGIWELGGAYARVGIHMSLLPLYVGSAGMLICAWTLGAEALLAALFLTIFASVLWRVLDRWDDGKLRDICASAFTAVYVPFLASFIVLLLREHHAAWVVGLQILLVALSDTGGWATGILIGRHPMAPRLSPKKSWEGFAGSLLACTVGAVVCFSFVNIHWAWGFIVGPMMAFSATIGDLIESLIKREVGLKDMSQILPGHGGVLDRADSILLTAPVLHVLLLIAEGGHV
ncbi:phosphatidate cytidylyltransferase [Schaalia sp. lx-260]|uniref:phosphatidate cytidylyltransferase n=1 Tax=Schaalia sp. lx-260 TaxID=2899082 RepID=UPI001E423EDA|nr:phosphatidate cytidylyltransferase [Schaalia sp. lx-260]MCD4549323.1 phosphatidate cytidylyltransferase [Schaalia sp. lx-260]